MMVGIEQEKTVTLCQSCVNDKPAEENKYEPINWISERPESRIKNNSIEADNKANEINNETLNGIELILKEPEFNMISIGEGKIDSDEIWIADSGATCDSTPYGKCIVEENDNCGNTIEGANGAQMTTKTVGNLYVDQFNSKGEKVQTFGMQNVHHVPKMQYQLFSITSRLKKGWKLQGNDKHLILEKGNNSVKFDIIIETENGRLYCT